MSGLLQRRVVLSVAVGGIKFAVRIGLGGKNLGLKRVQGSISSPNLNVKIGSKCKIDRL